MSPCAAYVDHKAKGRSVPAKLWTFGGVASRNKLRWRFILTGDESWFFDYNAKRKLWVLPDVDVPQVARELINAPKVMVTLFWNPWGVHMSNALLSESFNADYFVRHVLQPFHSLQIVAVTHKQEKRFILHVDNSPIHKAKVTKAKLSQMPINLVPHPSYSPDLAPSAFFLFGYLKEKILSFEFESPEALLASINPKCERIPREILGGFFECWIIRVHKCSEHRGDYFPEDDPTLETFCSKKA
jgi:hypothetical protein